MDALKSKGQMYDQIDLGKISRSGFDLSWNNKGTGKIGRIIPTRCTEVLPGDRFKGSSAAAVQFEPLAVPILANMDVRQEHFYVPNNILWRNWDKFITGGQNLDDTSVLPTTSIFDIMTALFKANVKFPNIKFIPYCNKSNSVTDYDKCDGYLAVWTNSEGSGVKNFCDVVRSQLNAFGEKYGCLDLLKSCFEVLDNIESVFSVLTDPEQREAYKFFALNTSVANLYGIPVAANIGHLVGGANFNPTSINDKTLYWSYFESMSSNTIVSSLIDTLKAIVSSDTTTYIDFPMTCYTEVGYQMFNLFYEFYRQFVGVGSNLDYLNMSRVSQRDVYLMLLLSYVFKKSNIPYFSIKPQTSSSKALVYMAIGSFSESDFSNDRFNVLPLRANYAIWYNYYRDQLLETLPPEPSDTDTVTDAELLNLILPRQRCWAKDTFTTALANTGTGSMMVPINSEEFPFEGSSKRLRVTGVGTGDNFEQLADYEFDLVDGTTMKLPTRFLSGMHTTDNVDVSNYYGFSLDMLNRVQRAQKWLQKALIYGNRIQDRLFTSFGVKFLDNRLKLPEFLSSSRQMVQLSVNTNPTTIVTDKSSTVAGDKSANAYGYDKGDGFNRFCEEHGFILSYLTIMPEATYPYSVSRHYSKLDKFDYAWPEFSTIGMDAVYNKELCDSSLQIAKSFTREVFGYQGRYYDYKCHQDEEHGELQTTQNMYTFSREYDAFDDDKKPKLNYMFVHCWPSLDMFVVDSSLADYFRYDIHHSVAAERPLPVCGMYL